LELDIEEAFDSTSFDIITKAAKRNGLGDTICHWIGSMLSSRKITATLAGETLEGSEARGCPQGGVLSPQLWSLAVDELIEMATIHWDMQMTLLSLSVENSQTLSQSFYRRF
jgi:retron-type reverse transcriptase